MEQAAPAAPAAEAPSQPAPGATPAADPNAQAPEAPKPERTFSQAELDEILKKKDAKRLRERDDLRKENEVLRKLALERAAREERDHEQRQQQTPQPAGEPTRENYATTEEYLEARAEWKAEQKVEKKFKEREDAERQRTEREKNDNARAAFNKRMKDSAKEVEDFEDVIGSTDFRTHPVGQMNAEVLDAADEPGRMFHYLIKHPEEAERIASLPMGKQAREIWSLEQKTFSAKPPVKPSKAPEPISPVGGKAAVGDEMPDAAKHPEKWMEWRNRQIAEKAKRGVRA